MARLLDHGLQFLAGVEGHDATRADRDLLAGLRVAPRALRLFPQLEVAEPPVLYAFAAPQRAANFLLVGFHHVLGLPLVYAGLLEYHVGQLRLCQRHYGPPLAL